MVQSSSCPAAFLRDLMIGSCFLMQLPCTKEVPLHSLGAGGRLTAFVPSMARGPKKHLKRLNAPSHWMLDKLGGIFVSIACIWKEFTANPQRRWRAFA